jgi:CubicO group peptidase (beta-lactamase class C family)
MKWARVGVVAVALIAVALIAVALIAVALIAGGARADAVDAIMTAAEKREAIPGLALLVMRNGAIVRIGTYGLANVEHGVPVKRETLFQSGSLGKQFTATAVLLLTERGKLSLDDRIDKFLPAGPPGWEAITIRHLLNHTSGIKDPEEGDVFDYRREYSDAEIIKVAQSFPLEFPVGSRWKYNNMGYILAGIIVTRVSGMFYGDFLAGEVFKPLGMRTARIISDTDIVPNRAAGYVRTKTGLRNQDFVSAALNATADGSLYLSLDDWGAWIAALDRRALLSRASYDALWGRGRTTDGQVFDHGFGWDHAMLNGHALLEFDGSWQGFRSAIERDPNSQLTVVVLANLAEASPDRIAREVIAAIAGFGAAGH